MCVWLVGGGDGAWEILLGRRTPYDLTSLSEPGLGFSFGKRPTSPIPCYNCLLRFKSGGPYRSGAVFLRKVFWRYKLLVGPCRDPVPGSRTLS